MKQKELKLLSWWPQTPRPGNFGDIMSPWLCNKLFNVRLKHSETREYPKDTLLAIGSIAQTATSNCIVWGSGFMSSYNTACKDTEWLAVRGPRSRDIILKSGGVCPSIFGDPALCAPLIYKPNIEKKYDLGIFPHYVDYEKVVKWYGNDKNICIINPTLGKIEQTIDLMLQCKTMISSSLHGIIVSQAYDIPTSWVKFSNKLAGDGNKFLDYFDSVGIYLECVEIPDMLNKNNLLQLNKKTIPTFDCQPLINSFKNRFL